MARGIERNDAHEPFLERLRDAVSTSDDDDTTRLVSRRIEDLDAAITAWAKLDGPVAEARLFPLERYMGDVYAGALLTEQAAWERETRQSDRKTLVARLYALRYLADVGPLRGIDAESDDADRAFRRARGGRTGDLVSSPSNSESTRHAAIWGPSRLLAGIDTRGPRRGRAKTRQGPTGSECRGPSRALRNRPVATTAAAAASMC